MSPTKPAATKDDAVAALQLHADQSKIRQNHSQALPTQTMSQDALNLTDSEFPRLDVFLEAGYKIATLYMTIFSTHEHFIT